MKLSTSSTSFLIDIKTVYNIPAYALFEIRLLIAVIKGFGYSIRTYRLLVTILNLLKILPHYSNRVNLRIAPFSETQYFFISINESKLDARNRENRF